LPKDHQREKTTEREKDWNLQKETIARVLKGGERKISENSFVRKGGEDRPGDAEAL